MTVQYAGQLRYRGTLQQRDPCETGTLGQSKEVWSDIGKRYAKVEHLRGRELERARQVVANATTRLTMRKPRGYKVDARYRFLFRGVIYNASFVREIGERLEDLEMLCESNV